MKKGIIVQEAPRRNNIRVDLSIVILFLIIVHIQSGAATRERCFVTYVFKFPFVVVALLTNFEMF